MRNDPPAFSCAKIDQQSEQILKYRMAPQPGGPNDYFRPTTRSRFVTSSLRIPCLKLFLRAPDSIDCDEAITQNNWSARLRTQRTNPTVSKELRNLVDDNCRTLWSADQESVDLKGVRKLLKSWAEWSEGEQPLWLTCLPLENKIATQ
jgi:hypothetical protein